MGGRRKSKGPIINRGNCRLVNDEQIVDSKRAKSSNRNKKKRNYIVILIKFLGEGFLLQKHILEKQKLVHSSTYLLNFI